MMHLFLCLIGYMDMRERRIPNSLSALLFLWFFLENPLGIMKGILGFLLFSCLYMVSRMLFKKEVMGFGDVKLLAILCYGLEESHMEFILLSFLLAGLFGFSLLFRGKNKEESFAFAPFLILSFLFYFH